MIVVGLLPRLPLLVIMLFSLPIPRKDEITSYIHHPQTLKLTKKERRKLRKLNRQARQKAKQEMIRKGWMAAPKTKVKMCNLMKVLGSEATQDPTRLEKEIIAAAAECKQAHKDRNIARKLSLDELRKKKERMLFGHPNNKVVETRVSVYKINGMSNAKALFKIEVNAQENQLTGCAVISDVGFGAIVVVEGGSKSINRYAKVMLRRINRADHAVKDKEEDDKPVNKCVLLWQGSVARPSFDRFSVHQCRTQSAAWKFFADNGVGHYWDLSVNYGHGV